MKPCFFILFALLSSWICGCSQPAKEAAAEPAAEKPAASRVTRGTNGEVIVKLEAETQKLIGLQTTVLSNATLKPELKCYGRVLDLTSLGPQLVEFATAQLAADSSRKEFERTKVLREQNNASERALQTAESASLRDSQAVRAILARVESAWGKKFAELVGSSAPASTGAGQPNPLLTRLVEREILLVRVDLHPETVPDSPPGPARLVTLPESADSISAEFFDFALTADPTTQSRGLLYLVQNAPRSLAPGIAVTAFIPMGDASESGVVIPRSAIIRTGGQAWIYVQTEPEEFTRQPVTLDWPVDSGWFIRSEPAAGAKVVTIGAQQILSEELKGQGE